MSSRLFSSISVSVSDFMLRSPIYLDLRFVQGDKNGSFWVLRYADSQFDQYHLLKMLSCSVCISGFFIKNHSFKDLCLVFNSIPLINVSILIPILPCFYYQSSIVQLEVRNCGASSSCCSELFQVPCFYLLLLFFHIKLRIALLRSVKNGVGMLVEIVLDL